MYYLDYDWGVERTVKKNTLVIFYALLERGPLVGPLFNSLRFGNHEGLGIYGHFGFDKHSDLPYAKPTEGSDIIEKKTEDRFSDLPAELAPRP